MSNPKPELSFDGHGINGPNEYRDRLATFNRSGTWDESTIQKYGRLFEAAPELLIAAEAIVLEWARNDPRSETHAQAALKHAIAKAKGV